MPIVGVGLHLLLALFCAVHAIRHRQNLYWLIILFSFPLLGSLVYFFAIYLPNSRLERGARRAVASAVKAIDPLREVREARTAFDDAPTAQNQMRLAAALLEAGSAEESAAQYQACLQGPFATDPEIRYGAGRALTECGRYVEALRHLESLKADRPDFRPEAISILIARCLAGSNCQAEARAAFEQAVARYGTYAVKAEYAVWLIASGDTATARPLEEELDRIAAKWNALAREMNEPAFRRLQAARKLAMAPG